MSRTYRQRDNRKIPGWIFEEYDWDEYWNFRRWKIDPKSKEAKKRIAKFRSDSGYMWHNCRGPGWFHREYTQCPYRRDARDQIAKFLKEEVEDIILLSKPKREYWD